MIVSQCSSRKARTAGLAFSGDPYSESRLQALLNCPSEWSEGASARINMEVSRSLYNVFAPWYPGARRRETRMTPSSVSKENSRTEKAGAFAVLLSSGRDTPAAASFTLLRRFRSSSAPWSFSRASVFTASVSPAGVNFDNRVSRSAGSSSFVIISTIES